MSYRIVKNVSAYFTDSLLVLHTSRKAQHPGTKETQSKFSCGTTHANTAPNLKKNTGHLKNPSSKTPNLPHPLTPQKKRQKRKQFVFPSSFWLGPEMHGTSTWSESRFGVSERIPSNRSQSGKPFPWRSLCVWTERPNQTEKPGVTNQPTNQPTNQVHSISGTILYSLKAITQGHQSKTTISQLHDTLLEGCRRLNKWCRPLHPWTRRLPHWDRRFGSIFVYYFDESINHLETYPMSDHSLLCSFRFWPLNNNKRLGEPTQYQLQVLFSTVGTFVSGTSSGIPSNQGSSPPWFGWVGFSPNYLQKKKLSNWLASSFRDIRIVWSNPP